MGYSRRLSASEWCDRSHHIKTRFFNCWTRCQTLYNLRKNAVLHCCFIWRRSSVTWHILTYSSGMASILLTLRLPKGKSTNISVLGLVLRSVSLHKAVTWHRSLFFRILTFLIIDVTLRSWLVWATAGPPLTGADWLSNILHKDCSYNRSPIQT